MPGGSRNSAPDRVINRQSGKQGMLHAETPPLPSVPSTDASLLRPPGRGGHRRQPSFGPADAGFTQKTRFVIFAVIGAGVFLLGLGIQIALVRKWHVGALPAYIVQGVISVQVSFLLNRFWTWRDVSVPFFAALVKFNIQKIVTTIANTLIFDGLVSSGLNYIVANIATTAIFTVVNYLSADTWVFARPGPPAADAVLTPEAAVTDAWDGNQVLRQGVAYPTVTAVVPCKGSERTIGATVSSLLSQDYPALESVVLVGSPNDTTWRGLEGIADPRLVIVECLAGPGGRDPNLKRDAGIHCTRSEIIALADSDIVMDHQWLSKAVNILVSSGTECVAGGMKSICSSFWGRFVDHTRMGAKTPRVANTYMVTRGNFGTHGRKPPVTANVVLTRRLYETCPLDVAWSFGYEDYEWFWRLVRAGNRILFSHNLSGAHHHRPGLMPLCREYLRSSEGCGRFIKSHPDCPLAIKRRRQAVLLPVAGMITLAAVVVGIAAGLASLVGSIVAIVAVAVAMWEYQARRTAESLVYPLLNILLGTVFVYGMLRTLMERQEQPTPVPDSAYA